MSRRCTTHKTAGDHIVGRPPEYERNIWRCSGCGLVGAWQLDWLYYGNLECPRCHEQAIHAVYCGRCAADVDQSRAPGARR